MTKREKTMLLGGVVLAAAAASTNLRGVDVPSALSLRWRTMARGGLVIDVTPDVAYSPAGGAETTLDVTRPRFGTGHPVLVMIHGGGWRGGTKGDTAAAADDFACLGYTVFNVNYRLAPRYRYPIQVQDCRAAVWWVRRHAAEYGGDSRRIGAWGESAGGHLAAFLGTTATTHDAGRDVEAVVSVSGPFDFTPAAKAQALNPLVVDWLGAPYSQMPETYRQAGPISHVSPRSAPFLLVDGDLDTLVKPEQDDRFAAALHHAGVEARVLRVHGADHVLFVPKGNHPIPSLPAVTVAEDDFLRRHLTEP